MKSGAAVPKNLRIQHNRQPGQGHPIGSGCGGKGIGNRLAGQAGLYVRICCYKFAIIGGGELTLSDLFESDKGNQNKDHVNQKDTQFFGCLFHQ